LRSRYARCRSASLSLAGIWLIISGGLRSVSLTEAGRRLVKAEKPKLKNAKN